MSAVRCWTDGSCRTDHCWASLTYLSTGSAFTRGETAHFGDPDASLDPRARYLTFPQVVARSRLGFAHATVGHSPLDSSVRTRIWTGVFRSAPPPLTF